MINADMRDLLFCVIGTQGRKGEYYDSYTDLLMSFGIRKVSLLNDAGKLSVTMSLDAIGDGFAPSVELLLTWENAVKLCTEFYIEVEREIEGVVVCYSVSLC